MDLPGGPTFEDLSIDDELTQLERVVRYSSSSIALQRLVHVKVKAEPFRRSVCSRASSSWSVVHVCQSLLCTEVLVCCRIDEGVASNAGIASLQNIINLLEKCM